MVGHQPAFHPDSGAADLLRPVRRITPAELRVLRFVALGMTSREIAERLWVSRQAVTYHIGNLFMKLRADMMKKQGAAFNLEQFHNDFMRQGFAPIKIIRKAMLHDDSPVL